MLPAAGAAVLGSLALAALALPWLSATVAARSGRRQAAVRARLLGELIETIDGAAELVIAGRAASASERLAATTPARAPRSRRRARLLAGHRLSAAR